MNNKEQCIARSYRIQKINAYKRIQLIKESGLIEAWQEYNKQCDIAGIDPSRNKRLYWFCKQAGLKV